MHEHGAPPASSDHHDHHHDHAHHGHRHEPQDVLARADRLCEAQGLQFTKLRRDVLASVAASDLPLGAYDIAERLSVPGKRVAPVSVYRALDFLTEHGLVHRIASRNAFVPCAHDHGEGADLVFMICRSCGAIDETTSPGIEKEIGRTVAEAGFKPASRILEVEGECGACLGKAGKTSGG